MHSTATNIALEFLASAEPRLRQNALTALAAVGTSEAVQHLVSATLSDGDAEVRKRGRDEILQLDGPAAEQAVRVLEAQAADAEYRQETVWLLGALRQKGQAVGSLRLGFTGQLRLRQGLTSRKASRLPQRRYVLLHAFLATLVSSVLLAAFYNAAIDLPFDFDEGLLAALLSSLFVGPWLAVSTSWFSIPHRLQTLLRGGVTAELALVAVVATPVPISLFVIMGLVDKLDVAVGLFLLAAVPLAVVACRATTLFTVPRAAGSGGRLFQLAAGAACGFLVLSLGLSVLTPLASSPDPFDDPTGPLGYLWVLMLPALVGVAAAFSKLESGFPTGVDRPPGWQQALAWVAVVGIALVLLVLLPEPAAETSAFIDGGEDGVARTPQRFEITEVPFDVRFSLPRAATIRAQVTDEGLADFTLTVETRGREVAFEDDPPYVETELGQGNYRLVAAYYSGSSASPQLQADTGEVPYLLGRRLLRNLGIAAPVSDERETPSLEAILDLDAYHRHLAEQVREASLQEPLRSFLDAPASFDPAEAGGLTGLGIVTCDAMDRCSPTQDAWAVAARLAEEPRRSEEPEPVVLAREVRDRGAEYPLQLLLQPVAKRDPGLLTRLSTLPAFQEDFSWLTTNHLVECPQPDDLFTCDGTDLGRRVYDELSSPSRPRSRSALPAETPQ